MCFRRSNSFAKSDSTNSALLPEYVSMFMSDGGVGTGTDTTGDGLNNFDASFSIMANKSGVALSFRCVCV